MNTNKAPDKIYLNTPKIQPELDNTTWDTKTYADCENTEYIRKDIVDETIQTAEDHAYFAGKEKMREELLEWAKETLEILNTDRGINEDFRKGAACELEEVIKHIKSM